MTCHDDVTRGLVLNSIGATPLLPSETGFFCYDARGARYDVPWVIVAYPSNAIPLDGVLSSSSPTNGNGSGSGPDSVSSPVSAAPTNTAAAVAAGFPSSHSMASVAPSPARGAPAGASAETGHPSAPPPDYNSSYGRLHGQTAAAAAAPAATVAPAPACVPASAVAVPAGPLVRFTVLASSGGRLTVEAPAATTRRDLTRLVRAKFGVPPHRQRVVVRGYAAHDDALTLADMRVRQDNVVQVFFVPEDVAGDTGA